MTSMDGAFLDYFQNGKRNIPQFADDMATAAMRQAFFAGWLAREEEFELLKRLKARKAAAGRRKAAKRKPKRGKRK